MLRTDAIRVVKRTSFTHDTASVFAKCGMCLQLRSCGVAQAPEACDSRTGRFVAHKWHISLQVITFS